MGLQAWPADHSQAIVVAANKLQSVQLLLGPSDVIEWPVKARMELMN